ncbi:hypothetical protein QBC43DRAFT_46420 [Cladorrhinum sp. PSN259]|nr:hypothetical protein QBC43DRAFT_46420 [Cladorrhinum sp. PSN259]
MADSTNADFNLDSPVFRDVSDIGQWFNEAFDPLGPVDHDNTNIISNWTFGQDEPNHAPVEINRDGLQQLFEDLSQGESYRPPDRETDLLLDQQPVAFPNQIHTAEDLAKVQRNSPELRDHVQEAPFVLWLPREWKYRQVLDAPYRYWELEHQLVDDIILGLGTHIVPLSAQDTPNLINSQQVACACTAPAKLATGHLDHEAQAASDQTLSLFSTSIDEPRPKKKAKFMNTSGRFVCTECIFSKQTADCDGTPEKPCSRCLRMVKNVRKSFERIQHGVTFPPLTVPEVVLFDIRDIQGLLSELRREIDDKCFANNWSNLEECFGAKGHIVCHLDEGKRFTPYSPSSVTIAVTRLATTEQARVVSEGSLVMPSLAASQLDIFTDARAPKQQIRSLPEFDQSIITTAWRCAYYVGVLFNWSAHLVYFDRHFKLGISLAMSKNLILELMYAVACRIQELATMLLRVINGTLYTRSGVSMDGYNPATVLCALRIIYSAVSKLRGLKKSWNCGDLVQLKSFLDGLHSRAPAAINAIQRYRHQHLGLLCRPSDISTSELIDIIEDSTVARSMVSFAIERFLPDGLWPLHGLQTGTQFESYTEILACPVPLINNDDRLLGRTPDRTNLDELQKRVATLQALIFPDQPSRRMKTDEASSSSSASTSSRLASPLTEPAHAGYPDSTISPSSTMNPSSPLQRRQASSLPTATTVRTTGHGPEFIKTQAETRVDTQTRPATSWNRLKRKAEVLSEPVTDSVDMTASDTPGSTSELPQNGRHRKWSARGALSRVWDAVRLRG